MLPFFIFNYSYYGSKRLSLTTVCLRTSLQIKFVVLVTFRKKNVAYLLNEYPDKHEQMPNLPRDFSVCLKKGLGPAIQ